MANALERIDVRRPGSDLPLLSVSQTRGVIRRSELTDRPARAESLDAYKVCLAGDIVFNKMSVRAGAIGVAAEDGLVTYHYEVMRPRPGHEPRFLIYLMKSSWFVAELVRRERGIGAGDESASVRTTEVPFKVLRAIPALLWPIEQQRAIADYLDRETAQTDTLIAKQEQLIATLRERRIAAVASALGRGDGRRVRVKDVVGLVNGYPFDAALFRDSGDIPLVRIRDILGNSFETFLAEEEVPEAALVRDGDLVIGMDGDFNSILWTRGTAALNQRVCLLRETGHASTAYLSYALPAHLRMINDLTYSTTVKHLSSKQVRDLSLSLPSLDEQHLIVAELDAQTAKIDTLIEKAEQFIALAKERRAALITAAVTGQIVVPGFDLNDDETTKAV